MDREPDVEIRAKVRARELRFEEVPEVRVRAYADKPAMAERISERDGLPDAVQLGVTYRDISVRWGLAARFLDADELKDESSAPKGRGPAAGP